MPEPQPENGSAGGRDQGPPDGRARLAEAMRRPGSRGQLVAGLLLAVVGFAAVTQVRANNRDDSFVGARQSELIQYINNVELASDRARQQIAALEATRGSLTSDTAARRTALDRAKEQADTLAILAGTEPATGPGIRVEVRDTGSAVGTNQLVDGLQELRDAGAEVIELAGAKGKVRVVASTWLQDSSGGGVLVDGTELRPPYVFTAIGDPHTLATALDFSGGFLSEVRGVGAKVSVQQRDTVTISSVRKVAAPRYAKPGRGS